jgi:hypothetical protein
VENTGLIILGVVDCVRGRADAVHIRCRGFQFTESVS